MNIGVLSQQFSESNCLDELEKLRNANQLAQQLLTNTSKNVINLLEKTTSNFQASLYKEKKKQHEVSPASYDSWGASQYLQKNNFKYVDDYLHRTKCLLNMSDSVQNSSFSNSYEVVSSTDDLLSGSVSHSQSTNDDSSFQNIEKPVEPASQSPSIAFDEDLCSDTTTALPGEHGADLVLLTHRPNNEILQQPIFDPQMQTTLRTDNTPEQNDSKACPEKENLNLKFMESEAYLIEQALHKHNFSNRNEFNRCSSETNRNPPPVSAPISHQPINDVTSDDFKKRKKLSDQSQNGLTKTASGQLSLTAELPFVPSLNLETLNSDVDTDQDDCVEVDSSKLSITKTKLFEDTNIAVATPVQQSESMTTTVSKQSRRPYGTEAELNSKLIKKESPPAVITFENRRKTRFPSVRLPVQRLRPSSTTQSSNDAHKSFNPVRRTSRGWYSLPDELLLHVFTFLPTADLMSVGRVCRLFDRVSSDRCLWRSVEVSDSPIGDRWLADMGGKTPKSVSLTRCDGSSVTNLGLRNFFKKCKTSLHEIRVEKCAGEYLSGDAVLLHASCHCRALNSVDVAWSKTSDNGLIAIAVALPRIRALNINGNSSIGDEAFRILTERHAQHLQSLEMSGCFAVSSEVLLELIQSTTELETLNLGLCSKLTSEAIIRMCPNLRLLRQLDLRGLKSLSNQCLHAIARHCESLQTLVASNCPAVTDVGVAEIATYRNSLKHLDVSGCSQVSDTGATNFVASASAIEHLDLSSTGATYKTVDFIATNNCLTLKTLKLSFCHNINVRCLVGLLNVAPSLRSLHVYGCKRLKLSQLIKVNKSVVIEK